MRLAERWPRLSRRVADRLAPGRITGLPLTLIAVAAAYLALLIGGVVEELMEADELQAVDRAILAVAVEPLRHPAVVRVFAWITRVGDTVTLVTAALVATGFLLARGPRAFVLPIGVTVLGAQVTTWGGKYLFDRSRPEFLYEVTAASPAFPSGHATGAAAVYGFIAYVLVRDLETAAARHAVGFWIAYGVALIAASRLLLNVHWPSDVAVGLLVGGFWLLAGISVAELLRARDDRSSNRARA
ncbi:MAG: phosphatase PAP2 family protein [Alphaproteobacteria bacterium]|jgi:undecaprenyl-diphosphatase|nr:phosphatase PAP2 family protein [Alphaproteobacteria bacterium]